MEINSPVTSLLIRTGTFWGPSWALFLGISRRVTFLVSPLDIDPMKGSVSTIQRTSALEGCSKASFAPLFVMLSVNSAISSM